MDNLAELLKGSAPIVPTRRALLVIDLQNDLVNQTGKCPHQLPRGFVETATQVIRAFIDGGISVFWIRSTFETDRPWKTSGTLEQAGGDAVLTDKRHFLGAQSARSTAASSGTGAGRGAVLEDNEEQEETDEDEDEDEDEDMAAVRNRLNAGRAAFQASSRAPSTTSALSAPLIEVPRSSQQYQTMRKDGKLPKELFLSARPAGNCCLRDSDGFQIIPEVRSLHDPRAHQVDLVKSRYSAFESDLLLHLRMSLITELYLCGPTTNTSIYATAAAAAQYGFSVSLMEDCVGSVNLQNVISSLEDVYEVQTISSASLLRSLGQKQAVRNTVSPGSRARQDIKQQAGNRQTARLNATSSHGPITHNAVELAEAQPPETQETDSLTPNQQFALPLRPKPRRVQPLPKTRERVGRPQISRSASSEERARSVPIAKSDAPGATPTESNESPSAKSHTQVVSSSQGANIGNPPSSGAGGWKWKQPQHPVLGPEDHIGEGRTYVVHDIFRPFDQTSKLFEKIKNEVLWQKMYHASGEVPRLVCAQGIIGDDGSMPVYRHPSDQSLPLLHYSPMVNAIRRRTEELVGHPLNHCLIQLYRSGQDFISEHSDKTLDIVRGSSIVNVSFGAQRTMKLRTKKSASSADGAATRKAQLVPLPHGSIFVLDLETNMKWLHGINADKRLASERTAEELAYNGERISLTFRHIGTFLGQHSKTIWGQGATSKDASEPKAVINGDAEATQAIIDAFGAENQSSDFDWDRVYGRGFDVLHFRPGSVDDGAEPLLFPSGDTLADLRVRIALEELSVKYGVAGIGRGEAGRGYEHEICLRDTDARRTQIYGDVAILLYSAERYRRYSAASYSPAIMAEGLRILTDRKYLPLEDSRVTLPKLEELLSDRDYVAGPVCVSADVYVWPVVEEWAEQGELDGGRYPRVARWHEAVSSRDSVKRTVWADAEE